MSMKCTGTNVYLTQKGNLSWYYGSKYAWPVDFGQWVKQLISDTPYVHMGVYHAEYIAMFYLRATVDLIHLANFQHEFIKVNMMEQQILQTDHFM